MTYRDRAKGPILGVPWAATSAPFGLPAVTANPGFRLGGSPRVRRQQESEAPLPNRPDLAARRATDDSPPPQPVRRHPPRRPGDDPRGSGRGRARPFDRVDGLRAGHRQRAARRHRRPRPARLQLQPRRRRRRPAPDVDPPRDRVGGRHADDAVRVLGPPRLVQRDRRPAGLRHPRRHDDVHVARQRRPSELLHDAVERVQLHRDDERHRRQRRRLRFRGHGQQRRPELVPPGDPQGRSGHRRKRQLRRPRDRSGRDPERQPAVQRTEHGPHGLER